jgi:hypothetical protein
MKITLTLYPRFEDPIEIIIECVPALDGAQVEGYWDIDTNRVALSWRLFSDFNNIQKQSEKRAFFNNLKKVSKKTLS